MNRQEYIELVGLERCEFDDECDCCKEPTGGSWAKMSYYPESNPECDYYVCGSCIDKSAENYVEADHDELLNKTIQKIDELFSAEPST